MDVWFLHCGYRNRASGFNFNRLDNYGFTDPRALGERPR